MNRLILSFLIFFCTLVHAGCSIEPEMAMKMGMRIWQNESGGKIEGLTVWNKGEEFASLGIGHFIWYPEGSEEVFKETFPKLLVYFKKNGVILPDWLMDAGRNPWRSREEFYRDINSPRMKELRSILKEQIPLQVQFMFDRLKGALPHLLKGLDIHKQAHIRNQFERLLQTDQGIFVLLDYLNFKGEGVADKEKYKGQGWGLQQVLEGMHGQKPGFEAIEEFVKSAKRVLLLRVQNSDPARNENQWLQGWYNRLDGYMKRFN